MVYEYVNRGGLGLGCSERGLSIAVAILLSVLLLSYFTLSGVLEAMLIFSIIQYNNNSIAHKHHPNNNLPFHLSSFIFQPNPHSLTHLNVNVNTQIQHSGVILLS